MDSLQGNDGIDTVNVIYLRIRQKADIIVSLSCGVRGQFFMWFILTLAGSDCPQQARWPHIYAQSYDIVDVTQVSGQCSGLECLDIKTKSDKMK